MIQTWIGNLDSASEEFLLFLDIPFNWLFCGGYEFEKISTSTYSISIHFYSVILTFAHKNGTLHFSSFKLLCLICPKISLVLKCCSYEVSISFGAWESCGVVWIGFFVPQISFTKHTLRIHKAYFEFSQSILDISQKKFDKAYFEVSQSILWDPTK